MQHIASRESLEAVKQKVLEVAEPLDNAGLARLGSELDAVSDLLLRQVALRRTLSEGTMAPDTRSGIAGQLLAGKVSEQASAVVQFAVRQPWSSARDLQEALRRVSRTAMFLQAERTGELDDVEDQLFRFARTVESNRRLRGALGDRDLPVAVRQEVIAQLLGGKVLPATGRLAAYAVRGGRARDIVATLDALVEDAARARGWRVARVQAADVVGDSQRQDLSEALARLAGNPVDLQVTIDPRLLGGVVVQVGDLLVDSSTRHRLNELKEHLLASEEDYRIPGIPTRREATDG